MKRVLSVAALLLLITNAAAQDIQFRTRVDLVVVPVTVKGDGDRLIAGLTKDDFVVFEDGRQQTITNFTSDPVPLSAAVLVDTGLSAESLTKVQETFTALAGAFSPFDEVAVYKYEKFVDKVIDFSGDLMAVENALKTLKSIKPSRTAPAAAPGGPFSVQGPVINGIPVVPPGQIGVPPMPRSNPKVLHDAIFTAATDLAKREADRRRMVLVISDGRAEGSDHSFEETSRRLLDTGTEFYAIAMDYGFLNRQFSVLGDYAKTTGGDTFHVNSLQALERGYAKAAEQARNQYILGYVSSNKPSGPLAIFRNIEVRLALDGLEALHRKGYYQYP
ncbi:MAG: VWA domain-containing protein [Acidobacteria bacterium]|nr:VWA domain-containing protein [Acidobacteriota bacterium]